MLERVSPSAECAAHLLIRQFEVPVRSHRILGPSFWRNSGDRLDIPAWWPVYLDGVRSKARAQPVLHKEDNTRCGALGLSQARTAKLSGDPDHFRIRLSSIQQASLSSLSEAAFEYGEKIENDDTLSTEELDFEDTRPDKTHAHSRRAARPNPFVASNGTEDDPQTAWTRFVRTGQRIDHASPLLRLLANSSIASDLKRAVTAYNFIPHSQRSVEDFRAVVKAATLLNHYNVAIGAIREALSRQMGQDVFFKFLAYCVQNTLWNTAADLWKEAGSPHQRTLHFAAHHEGARSGNLAGRFISIFDAVDDLPSKVVRLADRLHNSDPILAARTPDLIYLCRKLAYLATDSLKCMNTIDIGRLTALFSTQQKLGLDLKLHFAALRTINRMPEKGAKSQLAKFIYSNFKLDFPEAVVPRWMFGTLIAILSVGREPPSTYRSLLEDYKALHGTPDNLFYSQVRRAFVNHGEMAEAQAVIHEQYQHSSASSADEINPLIRACAMVGDSVNAQVQFDRIRAEFGLTPNTRSWNELLLAYARSSDSKPAFARFEEMKKSTIQPNQYTWSIMASVASKRGDTNHAYKLLKQAERAGYPPSIPIIGAIVDSCLFNDKPSEAEDLVISTTLRATAEPTVRLWNSLFRYYAFKADSKAILRTQQTMRQFDIDPDGMTYATLMTALVVQNRTRDAAQILRTIHFSKSVNVTDFHYSILIHGFAKERNTNAATLVYREMLERFSRSTPSARLAMLHVTAIQDEANAVEVTLEPGDRRDPTLKPDFQATLDFLTETFQSTELADLASTKPNPGFRRRSPRNDIEFIFLSSLVSFLQRHGNHNDARKILDSIARRKNPSIAKLPSAELSWASRLENSSLRLVSLIKSGDWSEVDILWNEILALTLNSCSSLESDEHNPSVVSRTESASDHLDMTSFRSMIPKHLGDDTSPKKTLLPAHRFILSRQISHYIAALDRQEKHMKILPTMESLQRYGFQISGKNWNTIIQAFCRSSDPEHHVLAYDIFEKHVLPNAPRWRWRSIRRGWVDNRKRNRRRRALVEKGNPELCLPTYFTVVHLAMVLLQYYRSSGEKAQAVRFRLKQHPKTFKIVRRTPYLRDRVQGMLLRNRQVIGDPRRRPQPATSLRFLPKFPSEETMKNTATRDNIRSLLSGESSSARRRAFSDNTAKDDDTSDQDPSSYSLTDEPGVSTEPLSKVENTEGARFGILQPVSVEIEPNVLLANMNARAGEDQVRARSKLDIQATSNLGIPLKLPSNTEHTKDKSTKPSKDQEQDLVLETLREVIVKVKGEREFRGVPPPAARISAGPMRTAFLTMRRSPRVRPGASDAERQSLRSNKVRRSFWKNRDLRAARAASAIERVRERKLRKRERRRLYYAALEASEGQMQSSPRTA